MNQIKIFSKGWNFSQDGPGNRLVYHFQGCNFFCPWCSNPEGIALNGTLLVKTDKLVETVCPYGAITNKMIDRLMCDKCVDRPCLNRNRNEGVQWSAKEYAIAEIIEEIENARPLFYEGGGVTITGGEPTLQFGLLKMLLQKIKSLSVHTTMETNGTHPDLPDLFDLLDLLIVDLKHYDCDIHNEIIGRKNGNTLINLKKAASAGIRLWVRIPLIPGFNDGDENMEKFISVIKAFATENVSVELLRYHEYGKVKWEQAGMEYTMDSKFISMDDFRKYEKMFVDNNIKIINT